MAKGKRETVSIFEAKNDTIRIDCVDELTDDLAPALMYFCRRLGAPHLYGERIVPTMQQEGTQIFAAIRDRPWPPWGLRAQTIYSMCIVSSTGPNSVGLSPVFVCDEDLTNVGLIFTVYKETLEDLTRRRTVDVTYAVVEGSVLAQRVLTANGFTRSKEDIFLTEDARYNIYTTDAGKLLARLGLDKLSTPELLAHEIPDAMLERNALLHSVIELSFRPGLFDCLRIPEIISIDGGPGGLFQPGGPQPGAPAPS